MITTLACAGERGDGVAALLRSSPAMGAEARDDLVRRGREALAASDWETARSCFESARELGDGADILDGLSQAVHFEGDYERAIELKERAFAAYRRDGMLVEAAELARWLAFLHVSVYGNMAAANGWMAQAESLLDGVEEAAAHGWLTLDRAPWTDDPFERQRLAKAALAIARRFGDADLEFDALALLGGAYVASGRVAEGMALLDQAMAAVSAGEVVGHGPVGEIYCRLLSACEHAADVSRAEQWLSAVGRLVAWKHFVSPTCRSHYGGILIATGRWAEAEEELLAAIRVFERGYRAQRVLPLVRLAELRVRQGRFEAAELLLEGNEWHQRARRSLATIALGRGDLALAEDLARLCLEGQDSSDPACIPLLELLVEIRLAREDVDAAREALDRLVDLARGRPPAGGRGDVLGPRPPIRGSARVARACARARRRGAGSGGRRARIALRTFERLGAARDADAAGELLRGLGAAGRAWPRRLGKLTKRESEVLTLLRGTRAPDGPVAE